MIKVTELKSNYFLFGNKGAVWSNACHICKSGLNTTLCGVPPLSRNWGAIEKVEAVGCPKCIEIYNELNNIKNN